MRSGVLAAAVAMIVVGGCTASVVASPAGNLLITAAHCINGGNGAGYKQDIVFIPDYRDGGAGKG
jgi:V8-like Glu-specific endopeptidase